MPRPGRATRRIRSLGSERVSSSKSVPLPASGACCLHAMVMVTRAANAQVQLLEDKRREMMKRWLLDYMGMRKLTPNSTIPSALVVRG